MRPLMFMLLLLATTACAFTGKGYETPTIPVEVYSSSWDATRVRLYCTGEKYARLTIRDVSMARTIKDEVRLAACTWWEVVVEDLGGATHRSEVFSLSEGDCLQIEIGVQSAFLNIWTRRSCA